jgi:hypothetical protein
VAFKRSYNISNISYLNSPPTPFFFILSSPNSWNSFTRYHFSIYIHVYTVFVTHSPSHTLSPHLSPPTGNNIPRKDLFQLPVLSYFFICQLFYYYSFIHMCVHCLGHFSPTPLIPPSSPQSPSLPGRTCSALISNIVEEKT